MHTGTQEYSECFHKGVYVYTCFLRQIHKTSFSLLHCRCGCHRAVLVYTGMHGMNRYLVKLSMHTYTPLTDMTLEKVADRVFSRVSDAQERDSNPSSLLSLPFGDFSASLSVTNSLFSISLLGRTRRSFNDLSATRRHLLPNVSCSFFQPSTSYKDVITFFNNLGRSLYCKPWDVVGQ